MQLISHRLRRLGVVLGLPLLAVLVVGAPTAAVPGDDQPIFINEIHYDNAGSDTGEGVELAGQAAASVEGWQLVFYNGNGGSAYATIALTGALSSDDAGGGAKWVPQAGVQNGAPDGVALVDPSNRVAQFLSYEGTFTAVGGPADGLESSDIGIAQDGANPVGQSLQLTGEGSVAADFTWTSATASPGSLNAGQAIGGEAGPAIRLSEIRIDQPGNDDDEFAELSGPASASLDGITYLILGDGEGGSGVIEALIDLTDHSIGDDGFFVIADPTLSTGTADLTTDFNAENSDNVTHMLVSGATASLGDDLDTDDDGTLDATPWESELDRLALVEQDPAVDTEHHYGPPSIGPDGTFVPGHVYVCDDGWRIGSFSDLGNDTPGAANACDDAPDDLTLIHEIQGSVTAPDPDTPTPFPSAGDPADDSPLVGQSVTIEAVVTGWDDEAGQSNSGAVFHSDRGFFVQEEDADADDDPTTSEGIFIQFSSSTDSVADYQPGDLVRVSGTVVEHFEFTAIAAGASVEVLSSGTAMPTAATIETDIDRDGYEALESMRVTLPVGVANSGGTNRFGELMLTPGSVKDVLVRPATNAGLLSLDSDAGAGNPSVPRRPETASSTLVKADAFATVTDAIGPLGYSFDLYKILPQPGALPTVTPDAGVAYPFDGITPADDGELRITALNVENFFPAGTDHDGGPVSTQEYENKRDRIVDAIDRLLARPEIVGVEEVANLAVLNDVAANLEGYTAYLEEGNDNRGIDVGFLVSDEATVTGTQQIAATHPDIAEDCGDTDYLFDRPPFQVDIAFAGGTLSVINNHFSSKAAPDVCRDAQAAVLRDHVAGLEAEGNHVVVTGDLNAFEDESPLAVLTDGTTTLMNLWSTVPADDAYSFQFNGRLQTLDHMLATDGLAAFQPEVTYAHFNTNYYDRQWDEPSLDGAFSDGHSVSDHDPPVLTLDAAGLAPAAATLNGTVLKKTGKAAKRMPIELFKIEEGGTAGFRVETGRSSSTGSYSFSVEPGCYTVTIGARTQQFADGSKIAVHSICVEAGQEVNGLDAMIG